MKLKYAKPGRPMGSKGYGRCSDPSTWNTGPDPLRRDKYYAYLKHKAQANFRKETYLLTWEDWEHMWTDDKWQQRGRKIENLCLTRIDFSGAWSVDNVTICTRRGHFELKRGLYGKNKQDI